MATARTILDNQKRTRKGRKSIRMAPARTIFTLRMNEKAEEDSDGPGPDYLSKTAQARNCRKTILMAPTRTILDRLRANETAEGEFGWLRPGPS